MSNDLILKAQERIRFHEKEIARLQDFIAVAESLAVANLQHLPGVVPPSAPAAAAQQPEEDASERSSPTRIILEEAATYLRQEGRALPASDIYDRLVRRGLKIAGKNPKGNLTAKFATRKDVFSFDNETRLWSLTEWTDGQTNETPTAATEGASKITGGEDQTSLSNTDSGNE